MHDIYHKIVYSKLEEKFKEKIRRTKWPESLDHIEILEDGRKKEFKNPKDKIRTWTGFSKGTAFFAGGIKFVYVTVKKREKGALALYFELQDDKFRLFLFIDRDRWIDEMVKSYKGLLDDYFEILNRIKKDYGLKGEICPTEPNAPIQYKVNKFSDRYYYRYVQLNENMTIEELMKIMEKATEHIIESKDLREKMREIYKNRNRTSG